MVLRVRTSVTGVAGSPYLSTQFFESVGSPTSGEAQAAADKVANAWSALAAQINTNAQVAVEAVVDDLDASTGDLIASFSTTTTVTQPSAVGDPLPPANQGLMVINTGEIANSRRVRGRIFVPSPTESANSDGIPIVTYLDALNAAGAALLASPVDPALVVWRRPVYDSVGVLTRPGEAHGAIGVTGSPQWAILRSRRD